MPDTEHTPAPLEAPTEKTTGLADPPPVADSVAVVPATPDDGAAHEMAWGSSCTDPALQGCEPLDTPRWSVNGHRALPPAVVGSGIRPMAGLGVTGRTVSVGPPLAASGPSSPLSAEPGVDVARGRGRAETGGVAPHVVAQADPGSAAVLAGAAVGAGAGEDVGADSDRGRLFRAGGLGAVDDGCTAGAIEEGGVQHGQDAGAGRPVGDSIANGGAANGVVGARRVGHRQPAAVVDAAAVSVRLECASVRVWDCWRPPR